MRLKRNGNCFEDSVNKIIEMKNPDACLVHGLPEGRSGEAAKAGRYPHAWVEHGGACWEPATSSWYPKSLYYGLGNIKYVVRYSMAETRDILDKEDQTFGPWDQVIIDRDAEIELEFAS